MRRKRIMNRIAGDLKNALIIGTNETALQRYSVLRFTDMFSIWRHSRYILGILQED